MMTMSIFIILVVNKTKAKIRKTRKTRLKERRMLN